MSRSYTVGGSNTNRSSVQRTRNSVGLHQPTQRSRGVGSNGAFGLSPTSQGAQRNSQNATLTRSGGASGDLERHDTATHAEQRAVYAGGYTVIPPNEEKRRAIAEKAEAETRQYNEYKQANRLGYVSYAGTVGGVSASMPRVRTQQQRDQYRALPNAREKAAEYRRRTREDQDREFQTKRDAARRKTEQNADQERARNARLDADRRRKNEAFLKRLEGGKN